MQSIPVLKIMFLALMLALPSAASAQAVIENVENTAPPQAPVQETPALPVESTPPPSQSAGPVFNDEQYPPLVLTYWEHIAIKEARNARGLVRPPSESELMRDLKTTDQAPKPKPPPEQREIRLGGLVYHGKKDWVIWLNDRRVTPEALPTEVLDLIVYKEYVEMKWFDEWSNQIYPIRLRPHQRFNIDTRIFLPGN
jgi:hypothetical protein